MKTQKLFSTVLMGATLTISTQALALGKLLPKHPSSPPPAATPVPTPTPTPKPNPTPVPTKPPTSGYVPLWEKARGAEAAAWSATVRRLIEQRSPALFRGPDDVEEFCPMYSRLGTQDRLNFWVELTAGVAKYESGFDPASRMIETTMGTDPMTGKQVASEGLLQLSYQDEQGWPQACDFDYQSDLKFDLRDIRRSILNPEKNLTCGLYILNRQVEKRGNIALSSNVYWAVLKVGGKYSKLPQIKAITQALPFCKKP